MVAFSIARINVLGEGLSDFVFFFQNFDLLILLKLEEFLNFRFCSYSRTKQSGVRFDFASCIFENFLGFIEFFICDFQLAFGCFNMVAKKFKLSITVLRLLSLPTAKPLSAYHFWVKFSIDKSFMSGIMARPFMALVSGSQWVVPS